MNHSVSSVPGMHDSSELTRKTLWFSAYVALCVLIFLSPLRDLVRLSLSSDTDSHLPLIPCITLFLLFMQRETYFQRIERSVWPAAAMFSLGALLYLMSRWLGGAMPPDDSLALAILGLLCLAWAGFLFFYGSRAFRAGLFPLLFLLAMVPLPNFLLDRFILWLQLGSAEVTEWLFHVTGTPVFRQGMFFTVPGVTIEIAKECSGIRSTLALLILCLLTGYLLLRTAWARGALLLAALPVLVIKNGIRITTLTLLAIHVDPGFLKGSLHRDGGVLFFAIGLLILLPVLTWLRSVEAKRLGPAAPPLARPVADSPASPAEARRS